MFHRNVSHTLFQATECFGIPPCWPYRVSPPPPPTLSGHTMFQHHCPVTYLHLLFTSHNVSPPPHPSLFSGHTMFHPPPLFFSGHVSPQTPSSGQCFTRQNPFLATFHPQPPLLATYPPPPPHPLFRPMFQHSNPLLRPHNVLKLLLPLPNHKMSTLYCFLSETGAHNYSWKFKFKKEVYFFFF